MRVAFRARSTRLAFLCCCTTALMGLSQSSALTIYRIGGESIPPPDTDSVGAPADSMQFIQLSWDELDELPLGGSDLVEIHPDSIRPQFLPNTLNLTPQVKAAGGLIKGWAGYNGFQQEDAMETMWDGDSETYYVGQFPFVGSQGAPYCGDADTESVRTDTDLIGRCKHIWVTLPGVFPLHSIRVFPPPGTEDDRFIPTYTVGINDGDPLKIGFREREIWHKLHTGPGKGVRVLDFDVVTEVLDNRSPVLEFQFSGEPVQNIIFIAEIGNWWIAEFEVFGGGFAVSSDYASTVIDLEEPATLGPLSWSGRLHPGARVDLRMRSGETPDPNIYYRNTFRGSERSRYNTEGNPLDRASYLRLESGEQGGIAPDLDNWSAWSSPLGFSAQAADLGTPRPRRYVQFRADFHSGGRLDYLQFPVTQPPVLTRAVAEIEPPQVPARKATRFTLFLRPEVSVGDLGFDRIRIATPSRIDSVESISVAGVSLEPSQWQATIGSSRFEVSLPRMDDRQTGELVEIVFHGAIFDFGTLFDGQVYDSTRPWEVAQALEPGDAAFLSDNNSLTVQLIDVGQEVLEALEVSATAFTPNGDGVNDRLEVRFDLVNLSAAVPVRLKVFDLAGTRRAELPLEERASGPHAVTWDGMDDHQRLLPPGIYLLRLDVETDDDTFAASRVVSLAY